MNDLALLPPPALPALIPPPRVDRNTIGTREEWLAAFIENARPVFIAAGVPIPERLRVGVGFAFASRKAIGQCWTDEASSDAHFETIVSPVHDTGVAAADTLTHELVHAAVGTRHGHKRPFQALCEKVGLRKLGGKWECAGGEGNPAWHAWADPIIEALGPYPGARLNADLIRKKQSTRLLKVTCSACDFVARVSAKQAPKCVRCPDDECEGFLSVAGMDGGEGEGEE